MNNNKRKLIAIAMMTISLSPAWAQDDVQEAQVSREPGMAGATDAHTGHDMDEMDMEGMDHSAMPDAAPASGLRDPHAYAGGYDFSQFPMRHEGHELKLGSLLVDRLEAVHADDNTSAAYDLQAWYGGSFNRAVLKAEGDIDNGKLQEGRTELLWGHAIAPFWDAQLGLRYDNGVDPGRSWLALGIQGLAPYWFELNATAYVADEGRTALSLEAEYELLLTQKLILQPRLEADIYGKRDAERAQGSGLSELAAGIRLRYEIRREFAPYVGIEWAGKYGGSADYARAAALDIRETRAVAGVRFWF